MRNSLLNLDPSLNPRTLGVREQVKASAEPRPSFAKLHTLLERLRQGLTRAKRLTQHPQFEEWCYGVQTGELCAAFGHTWPAEG